MPSIIACKLPHGLIITHNGVTITLKGANIGEDLRNVSLNGSPADNLQRAYGFGLTSISDEQAAAFTDWSARCLYVGGDRSKGKLSHPFVPLENGAILGPFKSETDARKECAAVASVVVTGFEGLNPEKEGVEKADKK